MIKKILTILSFFLFSSSFLTAQIKEITGFPYIETYKDSLINNIFIRDMCQGPNGFMYFTSKNGIVQFDGNKWNIIKGTEDIKFELVTNYKNKAIFVLGDTDFGIIKPNETFEMRFYSLKHLIDSTYDLRLPKSLTTNGNSVLFATYDGIFQYYPEEHPDSIYFPFEKKDIYNAFVYKKDYIIFSKDSAFLLKDNKLNFIGNINKKAAFSSFESGGKLFVVAYPFDIYIIDENGVEKSNFPVCDSLKGKGSITAILSANNEILIGVYSSGVYRCNIKGDVLQVINSNHNLVDDIIIKLYEDKEKNIWTSCSTGLNRIEMNSPFQFIDSRIGTKVGVLFWSVYFKNNLILSFSNGLYDFKNRKLSPIKGGENVFNKVFIGNNKILMNSNNGIYSIVNNSVTRMSTLSVKSFFGLIRDKLIIKSLNEKLFALSNRNGKIKQIEIIINKDIDEIILGILKNESLLTVNETKKTFYEYSFSENTNSFQKINTIDMSSLLPKTQFYFELKDKYVLISDTNSLYKYFIDSNKIVKVNDVEAYLNPFRNDYNIKIDSLENIYLYNQSKFVKLLLNEDSYIKDPVFNKIQDLFLDHMNIKNSKQYIISSKEGFILYNPHIDLKTNIDYKIQLTNVISSNNQFDSILYNGTYKDSIGFYSYKQNVINLIDFEFNSLSFNFSAAFYQNHDKIKYSYLLDGFNNNWSSWNPLSIKEYTNLPEGDYTFKVKAKNIYETESSIAKFSFTILPPWYRTWWAYSIFSISIILLLYIIIKLNTRRLVAAKKKLEQIVRERTSEIEQQKEEIETQRDMLVDVNIELEKLSIVASETYNAVTIADGQGIIEWMNEGFTRLFGFTKDEFTTKYGANLIMASSLDSFNEKFLKCIENKTSVIYESKVKTKLDKEIWTQTTLTPIFDKNGGIKKIIVIDSDISEIKQAQEEIATKNKQITDSINYAQFIQNAILPSNQLIKNNLPNSLVFFKPKDIVSGDFYWFSQKKDISYIVCADATGHGVPGAFMSMIGSTLLNDIINKENITSPCNILLKLNKGIVDILSQGIDDEEDISDGMDISVCKIDKNQNKITLSLANHYAYIVKNNKVEIIDGDIFSIGGFWAKNPKVEFTNIELKIDEVEALYLFSDGFTDQPNEKKEKYKDSRFKIFIKSLLALNMEQQHEKLEDELKLWRGSAKQIDDILVIGIKF